MDPVINPHESSAHPSAPLGSPEAINERLFSGQEIVGEIPSEFTRVPVGTSVVEPGSVLSLESGRTYQGYRQGKYFLPNDPAEQDRLDFQHAALTLFLDGKLFLAPLPESPKYVLDVGTGTGIWAFEFAEQHPECTVVGSDLSLIQPYSHLPNCSFVQEDAEEPWGYDRKFDYVHLRLMVSCFGSDLTVMSHAYDNLRPGGWIEYLDLMPGRGVGEEYERSPLKRLTDLWLDGAASQGRDVNKARKYKQWLIDTGFVDVEELQFELPCQPWSDDPKLRTVGQYMGTNLGEGLRGLGWMFLQKAGLDAEEIESVCHDAKMNVFHSDFHLYTPLYIVYGRKPFEGEKERIDSELGSTRGL